MSIRFHNSLSRRTEDFEPIEPGKVGLYTCGPTVYNYAHIGNFRAYVFEDLLRRTLKYAGFQVHQVMNLTDVDDKTIRDSSAAGKPLHEFTQVYKDAFFEDLDTLRIERAEAYPAATDHVPAMIDLIKTLVDKGFAYQADDGCVYFSIRTFPGYGKLGRIQPDQMRSGVRISQDEYAKETAADFALWKAWDEEDGDVAWDSPWGRGRPGWHIECSAMSMKYLGPSFDIHTGGVDNMFPHHDDEIAQSEAASGQTFVRYWLHCAHLVVDGKKMSKSAGNFHTLRDVLDRGYSGREVRWVLLGGHYRQALNFTFQDCRDARATLDRVDELVRRLKETSGDEPPAHDVPDFLHEAEKGFREGLYDDLNISMALAALFDAVRDLNRRLDSGELDAPAAAAALDLLRRFDAVLGCLDVDREEAVPEDVRRRVDERQQARKAKDFAQADQLRDELAAAGWIVEDTPSGPHVKRG